MYEKKFIQDVKANFEAEKINIEQKIADLKKPLQYTDNPDNEDREFLVEEKLNNESLLRTYESIKSRAEEDLARIEKGIYGQCFECGVEISQDILESQPWAEHCGKCNIRENMLYKSG
jgi:RNA polymerase-binding transcription factor DksA